MNIDFDGVFKYYKYTLSIENVLSFSVSETDLDHPCLHIYSEKIRDNYAKSFLEKRNPVFTEKEIPRYLVSSKDDFDEFFTVAEDIEKTVNLRNIGKVKDNKINIENHPEYRFGENNYYQYGIVAHFAKESPKSKYKPSYLPCLVVLFDNIDQSFKPITPEIVFEQIKRFLKVPYNESIDKEELRKPTVVHNPKILEPYGIDFEKFSEISFEANNKIISLFNQEHTEHIADGLFLCAFNQNMTQGLIRLYEAIQKNKPNRLMSDYFHICRPKETKANTGTFNQDDFIGTKRVVDSYLNHYGAFNKEFCLSESQRVALTCYLQEKSIVPVNGAPGTGKTALLRAIAGDYIVKAALEAYDKFRSEGIVDFKTPIVCTSTNNQALYNISEGIESGFNSSKDDGLLYQRWIEADFDRKYKDEGKDVIEKLDLKERLFVPSIKSSPRNCLELSKSDVLHAINTALVNPDAYISKFEEYTNNEFNEALSLREKLEKCLNYFQEKIKSNVDIISDITGSKTVADSISRLEDFIVYHYIKEDKSWIRDLFYLLKAGDVENIEQHLKTAENEPYVEEYKDYDRVYNEIIENNKGGLFREKEQAKKDASFFSWIFYFIKRGALFDRLLDIEKKYRLMAQEQAYNAIHKIINDNVYKLTSELNNFDAFLEQKSQLDTTLRTDNFYFSIHLLEALFFINHAIPEKNYDRLVCPVCKQRIMYKNMNWYICSDCNLKCSMNNPNHKKFNEFEIEYILNYGKGFIDGVYYETKTNDGYINISSERYTSKNILTGILPLFPIVNITCNSMGTILTEKDMSGSNTNNSDIVDFMLIDEAGTITPSKMAVLHCAKRAMFFGDVKQLKPVYSFGNAFEKKVMSNFMDVESVENASHYFSCAGKSNLHDEPKSIADSMSIANNCCEFYLPYNKSSLEGDIWLKEHYRCSKSIIQIANEMTYENEIVPCKEDSDDVCHLEFVSHYEDRDPISNTNEGEASLIVDYIISNTEEMMLELGIDDADKLYKSIGIVTPFRNQHFLLESMINENDLSAIKVGTVHKFQGSERSVILFSSVYSTGQAENFFFNRGETDMLNVAVTRAKDIFVCFGHKDLLRKKPNYSEILVRHIDNYEQKKS